MKCRGVLGVVVLFVSLSTEDDADRAVIKANNGDLIIEPAEGRSIYIKTKGRNSKIYVNDMDITQALRRNMTTSDEAHRGKLDDSDSITTYITGSGGILSRMNRLETLTFYRDNASSSLPRRTLNSLSQHLNNLQERVRQILNGNDCSSGPCRNGGTCLRFVGGYFCQCPQNWEGKDCNVDVNECRNFVGTDLGCQNGATCINRQGYYECFCSSGWFGVHCTRRARDCTGGDAEVCGHGTCVPVTTGTGIVCICHQGWKNDATDLACATDVDECSESTGARCSVNPPVACINLPGSFRCGSCPRGYEGDGYKCFDIDECAVDNGGCSSSPLVACHNTVGSRMCGACPAGYLGDGVTCSWRGLCKINRGGCHPWATCVENLAISAQYVQCVCPLGMAGDGVGISGCYILSHNSNATDCSGNPCGHNGYCRQLERGITCVCNDGFTGPYCATSMNYCTVNPCMNGGTCRTDTSATGYRCECTALYSGNHCGSHARACGAVLESQEGSILYPLPNASSTYNHNSRCVWLIQTSPSKVINVTFSKFNLESSLTCTHDFLQIHDGPSTATQLIGRFCGSYLPKGGNIVSSHNTLYLWFRSDRSISREGFALHWTSVDPVCGGEVDAGTHGSLSSPGSPGPYPPNRDCNWHLLTKLGKRIQLLFFRMGLESHPDCGYDYLEIFDGAQTTDTLLKRFCNTNQPAPLQSAGSELLIHFHSDAYDSGEGFQILYAPIEGVPGCGGTYTQDKGEITSPSYNSKYLHDLLCDYKIQVEAGTKVSVKFLNFDLEQSRRCRFDHLEVYDGPDSTSKLVGKFCGRNPPVNFVSSSNTVYMQFKTDSTTAHAGFKISYEIACKETLTGDTGTLKSPGYPHTYPSNRICEYFISATPGKAIQLSFQHFDIEGNYKDCLFDNLQIRDGPDVNSSLLGRFCGSKIPPTLTTTHNYMHLIFSTDLTISSAGFLANYTTVDVACGGIYAAASGVISHPVDEQGRYKDEQECTCIIIAPIGHSIRITWTRFTLDHIIGICAGDYVQLIENQDGKVIEYESFCGNQIPPTITSLSNELKIYFKSDKWNYDNLHLPSGFSLTYVASDDYSRCGGNYIAPHGYIRSPGWPNNYHSNRECVWTITVPVGQQILLNISTFDLEYTRACSDDFLEIRNGPFETSPLIGKYCGETFPKKIPSHGNTLYLHFKCDAFLQRRGFQIEWEGTSTGCGGTVTSSSGSITSPNYPQMYSRDGECFWRIIVSAGSVVSVHFVDINMEHTTECYADYVELYDGKDANAKVLGRFCSMDQRSLIIKSSRNQVFIKFRSDISVAGKGFYLNYFTDCNTVVTGTSGVIESPDFPNVYPSKMNCLWTVKAPKGNKINATFTHFKLPQIYYSNVCNADYVQIKDGKDTNFTKEYCGNTSPAKFTTRDNTMNLKFGSGQYLSGAFRLEWVVYGCGGIIRKSYGSISPPEHRRGVKEHTECEWIIETPLGTSVQTSFTLINLIESPNCTIDSIEFFNGIDAQAPLLMKVCHHNEQPYQIVPYQIVSTSNLLFVRFSSTSGYAGLNFNAYFSATTVVYGGTIEGTSGSFTSPNYPKNYGTKLNCVWVIKVPEHYRVKLDITDLDLYTDIDATCADAIEIFEGWYDINNNYTLRHCGESEDNRELRQNFMSKANVISVRFTSGDHGAKGFKANFSIACGYQIISQSEGIIRTSLSAAVHTENNCTWTIIAEKPEQKVSLTFTSVTMLRNNDGNSTQGCSSDFLNVYDGNDVEAPVISRICSRRIPPTIISHGSAITILLGSYASSLTTEFSAHYSVLDTACGGSITSVEGTLASPGYPENYIMSTDCIWSLATSPGNKVYLTFEKFDLESSPNCNEDYVEVRDKGDTGEVLGVYCGNVVPAAGGTGENLFVKFHSDNAGTAPGFLAHYGYVRFNEIVGQSTGEVSSPLFPNYYRGAADFTWRISTNTSTYIAITIVQMEIDVRGSVCYNHLTMYEGYDDTAPILKRLCGVLNPDQMETRTTSNMIYVKLSLEENARSLFQFTWMAVEKKAVDTNPISTKSCGTNQTVFVNSSAQITSPNYPLNYDNRLDCSWVYETTPGRHLKVIFKEFLLEQSEDCTMDYVRIYTGSDGTNNWHPITEQICLSEVSNNNSLETTNLMKVVLHTDAYKTKAGFVGTVYSACGGLLTETSGIIEATASDKDVPGLSLCNWTVRVKPRRTIAVHFEQFHVASSTTSCTSYVSLKNGASVESPPLGSNKYCGENLPDVGPLETSGNTLFVTYMSDNGHPLDGFRLRYEEKTVDCGSSSTLNSVDTYKIINSLNYPEPPLPYSDCVWTVMGPPGEVLRLDFVERFDLSRAWLGSTECGEEHVEIRDGMSESSSLIGRFCDEYSLSNVKTTGNAIYVKYVTLRLTPNDGFKANISVDVCGGTVDASSGEFTSPGYPKYPILPIGTICEWKIIGDFGTALWINLLDLSLPESKVPCGTKVDIEEILPLNRSNMLRKTFCGGDGNGLESIRSTTNEVIVKLYVQKPATGIDTSLYKGFRINFNSTGDACGGKLTAPIGYIESPGYPQRMSSMYCAWEIQLLDPSRRIRLEFLDLDSGTIDIGINLYNDLNYRAPLAYLRDISYDSIQHVYESSGHTMIINAWTSVNTAHRGFRARYTSDEPAVCGGLLHAEFGTVTSPSGLANQTYYCQWRLTPGSTKNFEFNAINLRSSFTIYMNINLTSSETRSQPYLGPWITVTPNTYDHDGSNFKRDNYKSGVDELRIPFPGVNMDVFQNEGKSLDFTITWKIQPCGGHVEIVGDHLDILNLPRVHDGSLDCAWYVKVPPGRKFQLVIEGSFSSPCSQEYISIYESMYGRSPSVAEYCQSKPLTPLPLHFSSFYVQYHSDLHSNATTIKFKILVENSKGCGLSYGYERQIMTPNYPKSYSENQECAWDMSAPLGNKVSLQFQSRFHIEDSVNCTKDYVLVLDWVNDDYRQVARLCGRNHPENINSTSNRMKVIFRSDAGVNADGFRAWWDPICGGEFKATEDEQFFYSPNYPETYGQDHDCLYKIVAGNEKVIVKFMDFSLESGFSGGCEYDNVTIGAIQSFVSTSEYFCGDRAPPTCSYANGAVVRFRTAKPYSALQNRGFKLIYKIKKCGGEIKNHAVISSSKGEGDDENTNCIWNITAPANKNVVIRFAHFNLEDSGDCMSDYVAVFNGSALKETQRLAQLCGSLSLNMSLPAFTSTGPAMIVQYVSDYGFTDNSFKAEIYFSYGASVGCGGEIKVTSGDQFTLKSPILSGAQVYEKYLDCHWIVTAPADKVVKIEFTTFNIAPCANVNHTALGFSDCSCDVVYIRDGANPTSTAIGKYCGNNVPPKIVSTSNFMFVMLYTDGELESAGFEAKLTVEESLCGKQHFLVSDEVQHIKSPQYDAGYLPRGLHCTYHVLETRNKRIHVRINTLDMERHSSDTHRCNRDRVIFSGYTLHHNISIGKDLILHDSSVFSDHSADYFSEMTSPQTLYTMCGSVDAFDMYVYDSLTIRLFTDAAEAEQSRRGFDIEVTYMEDCNRNFSGLQGRIQSSMSVELTDCYTLLTVPEGYTISTYFFTIPGYYSMYSENEYIEILDGDQHDSKQLVRFSNSVVVPNAFSSGRHLMFHRHGRGYIPLRYDFNYVATDRGPGCGGKLNGVVGVVTSPMYPEPYRNMKTCEFVLETFPESRLKLRFESFDLGVRAACEQVYVDLIDRSGRTVRTYCSDDDPADFTSEDNYVKVVYHTTMNTGGPGWVANFIEQVLKKGQVRSTRN